MGGVLASVLMPCEAFFIFLLAENFYKYKSQFLKHAIGCKLLVL